MKNPEIDSIRAINCISVDCMLINFLFKYSEKGLCPDNNFQNDHRSWDLMNEELFDLFQRRYTEISGKGPYCLMLAAVI